jgi:hypothetical protein
MRTVMATALSVGVALGGAALVHAQRGGGPGAVRPLAKAAAPIDLTGYWVSVVTQDWRWRMVTPAKGDYQFIPMNIEAKKVADAWDPAKDEAAGEQCKSYGAPALMSVPGRVHITWQDDSTLKVDTDAGMQTRLLHFAPPQGRGAPSESRGGDWKAPRGGPPTWQGDSVAEWQMPRANAPLFLRPVTRSAGGEPPPAPTGGSLKVVTAHLRPGYLRKNGVPYSTSTVLTEYWDLFKRPNGDQWIAITTQIEDPVYLREPRIIGLQFKKEPNGDKWDPTPCSARW